MRDHYIFDLPIYRGTKEEYEIDIEAKVEAHVFDCYEANELERPTDAVGLADLNRMKGRFKDSLGGPWNFNQIIGCLRLFVEGYNIGGHVWRADGIRMSRTMPKKRFHLVSMSNCLWPDIQRPSSSQLIYQRTLATIELFAGRDWMKRRFLDLSVFKRTGPFVDWHALLESHLNPR